MTISCTILRRGWKLIVVGGILLVSLPCAIAQEANGNPKVPKTREGGQQADSAFTAKVATPRFALATGPVVAIDEAHSNFHSLDGRYRPFADVLRADGFQLVSNTEKFTTSSLAKTDVIVIANALAPQNVKKWSVPTPSAFAPDEIASLLAWVEEGGSLLLIADHMPFPGAAEELAAAIGIRMQNGFVFEANNRGPIRFNDDRHKLLPHNITTAQEASAAIPWVVSFTGSCFEADKNYQPILVLGKGSVCLKPKTAWEFDDSTESISATGMLQGAVRELGSGRVAVFGEAAMFSAQMQAGRKKFGLNAPEATHNQQFLLNVLHWLVARS